MYINLCNGYVCIPVKCEKCGFSEFSEPIRFEHRNVSVETFCELIKTMKIGVHFPIGWASFTNKENKRIFLCQLCHKRN